MKTRLIITLFIAMSILSACAQPTTSGTYPPPVAIPVTPTNIAVYVGPTPVATEIQSTPSVPQVDEKSAEQAAIQTLAKTYNIASDQVTVVSTEPVTWPNGCLGVVIPGVMCTNIVTPGYRVILQAKGQQYEFHTNQDGSSVIDAAQQLATLNFVVVTAAQTIQIVNPNIPLGPTYNPAFNGFLPAGSSILGTAYVLDTTSLSRAVAINANGTQDISFIQSPTYGLAIWRGGLGTQPMLAWGTQASLTDQTSSLMIANPDGSNLQTLFTTAANLNPPVALVAELWSADGQSLYFSKEPVGIGGYIIFSGASNLYKIDIKTKEVTEIIPQAAPNQPQTCLDAISGDYRYVADHCTPNVIAVRMLQTDASPAIIQPPADVTGYQSMGSARFSPTGDRVAFALAQGNPDNERGWVAIGDASGGVAKLILTGEPGAYYNVQGWLDDQTLLVQSIPVSCTDTNCVSQLYTVGADGSNPTKVADGSFLTVIDNR